jgi:MFS family permease
MNATPRGSSPFTIKNVRLFIAFRILFNARFYYPVFTIMFLDFGLTVAQFAFLNAVWATTIVVMEVPSGALADIWGRRNLVVSASFLMILEMLLICLAPKGHPTLLFAVFMMNRILSGTAEAAASGADEAIAYDALKQAGRENEWNRVLDVQMRLQAMVFVLAMTIGAAAYDPHFMRQVAEWLGLPLTFSRNITIRIPAFLTLVMATLAFAVSLRMREAKVCEDPGEQYQQCRRSIREVLRQTLNAGRWILKTPFAIVIIASGFLFDGTIRMVITLSSEYYRLINIPEALFGIIGSGIALVGLFVPRMALRMTTSRSTQFNFMVVVAMTFAGLIGMTGFLPVIGLIPVVMLFAAMQMTGFFLSFYLNQITASEQRATVLSFKGLALNLSYGLVGLLYSALLVFLRPQITQSHPGVQSGKLENLIFIASMHWFPWAFLVGLLVFMVFAVKKLTPKTGRAELKIKKDINEP